MDNEHSHMAMSSISHAALMCQYSFQQMVSAYEEPSAVYRPKVFLDGDQWCALYGDNLQDGVAGFGDTPHLATQDFNARWYGNGKHKTERKE